MRVDTLKKTEMKLSKLHVGTVSNEFKLGISQGKVVFFIVHATDLSLVFPNQTCD